MGSEGTGTFKHGELDTREYRVCPLLTFELSVIVRTVQPGSLSTPVFEIPLRSFLRGELV